MRERLRGVPELFAGQADEKAGEDNRYPTVSEAVDALQQHLVPAPERREPIADRSNSRFLQDFIPTG